MANPRLLCVTAHPDDEAGGFGGSLLLYHARGVDTHLICLTPGQAATHRGGHKSDEDLAAARRAEFADACKILKVTHGEVLDYPDGRLDRADLYAVVGELVRRIREIRPQVVITLGPEGAVTAHADHSMASIFTTMAYHWAGRSNRYVEQLTDGLQPHRAQKLYYATAMFTLPDRQPVSLAPATVTIDVSAHLEDKIRAFRAHTTQAPLFPLFENSMRKRANNEWFHLAARTRLGPMTKENDLFDGIEENL
jgi:LmbE family N-acetylglucosaminyl deacetylase